MHNSQPTIFATLIFIYIQHRHHFYVFNYLLLYGVFKDVVSSSACIAVTNIIRNFKSVDCRVLN